jgi:glycerol-3-phosphate dehydrogenase
MDRAAQIKNIEATIEWDVIIIGGGATGLGAAVDAASRGYKTLLLERFDFAKGTSSRATKLVHGGVRYLAQGNLKLVRNALKERGILLKNAPHVATTMQFIIPNYKWWLQIYYGIGLKVYDALSGKLGLGNTKILSAKKTMALLPNITTKKLRGAVMYTDGQFDDARLAINLAQTAVEKGSTVINYMPVTSLSKVGNTISGLVCIDEINKKEYHLKAKAVLNATGVFVDDIMQMDKAETEKIVSPSQGVHIVIEKKHFESEHALMVPKTSDGRVLFAVPWHNAVIVGTTDTGVQNIDIEPVALKEEVDFILTNLNIYLQAAITRADVKSVFVGLRPLVKRKGAKNTAALARDHTIYVSDSKLISITGGKWTTYRKMAEEAINNVAYVGKLPLVKSETDLLKIAGYSNEIISEKYLQVYGADAVSIIKLYVENESWKEKIHPLFDYTKAQVIWAVRNEMAQTVEDVLARRVRLLFIDANAAIESAEVVASLMAIELKKDNNWEKEQTENFIILAKKYLIP